MPREKDKRQRRGECPDCGIRLFKTSGFGLKKIPLTIAGHVELGRCLVCNPIKAPSNRPIPTATGNSISDTSVPQFLSVNEHASGGDDATIISAITFLPGEDVDDHAEIATEEREKISPTTSDPQNTKRRTVDEEPSLRPEPPKRASTQSQQNEIDITPLLSTREEEKEEIGASGVFTKELYDLSSSMVFEETPDTTGASQHYQEGREIFFDSSRLCDLETAELEHTQQIPVIKKDLLGSQKTNEQEEIFIMPETLLLSSEKTTLSSDLVSSGREDQKVRRWQYDRQRLRQLMQQLATKPAPSSSTLEAIQTELWNGGKEAKHLFAECSGFQNLTRTLWGQMVNEPLEEQAVELYLAVVAFDEDDRKEMQFGIDAAAVLGTEEARNALEAMLFVMQSLLHNHCIQITGCRTLVCLTTICGRTRGQIDDGSNAGAAAVLLASLSNHESPVVQKWALRALCQLCSVSHHSESNKRTLLTAVEEVREIATKHLHNVEAVQLVWCLSTNEDARGKLDPDGSVLERMVQYLGDQMESSPKNVTLIEALLGSMSNLSGMTSASTVLSSPNQLAALAVAAAEQFQHKCGLCTEALSLITNVCAMPHLDKNEFAGIKGVETIAHVSLQHEISAILHEEAVCALLSLSLNCEAIKAKIRLPNVFAAIKRMSRMYESSIKWQELLCCLISSVFVSSEKQPQVEREAAGVLCFALTLYPDEEKIADVCCAGLQNISCLDDSTSHLVASDAVELLSYAIAKHGSSKTAFANGCRALWNLGYTSTIYADHSRSIVESLVKGMRTHLDDAEVLEPVLGVLLCSLVGSNNIKTFFCNSNGLEVSTSAMLIHQENQSLLVKLLAVFSSLSSQISLVPQIVEAGAFSCAIEIFQEDDIFTSTLSTACQFLTNVVLAVPSQCEDVSPVVSQLIDRMRDKNTLEEEPFHSEACRLIWALASLSETVRSRILTLDGVAVLLQTVEASQEGDLQNNALEAFNELAMAAK